MMYRSLLLSFLTLGCAMPVDDFSALEQALNCPNFMCGSNSPEVDNLGMHEGNVKGLANANGFRLVKVDKGNKSYRMAVKAGEVVLTPIAGGSTISEYSVAGATLHFIHDGDNLKYDIRITQVLKTGFWAHKEGAGGSVYTYLLEWTANADPNKVWKNICVKPEAEADPGMDKFHAVIFEGDRIDPLTKRVKGVDTDWFNIGCAGHALAKMHLTGHTYAAGLRGFHTNLAERTTMLKTLSADYCGDGTNFTVAGVKLTWRDDKGWMRFSPLNAKIEALWTDNGAFCLNEPRLDANPTEEGIAEFQLGENQKMSDVVAAHCTIPKCPQWTAIYHLVSANP